MSSIEIGDREALFGGRFARGATVVHDAGLTVADGIDLQSGDLVKIWAAPADDIAASTMLRLQYEVSVLQRLNAPGLSAVLWAGRDDGQVCLVGGRTQGSTIADRLTESALSVDETLIVAESVLSSLALMHETGVSHLGITPASIFVDFQAEQPVTLAEPGVARLRRVDVMDAAARAAAAAYMSPEQAGLVGVEVDERTDLFALGAVIFECLAGQVLFKGATTGDIFRRQLAAQIPDLRLLGLPVPQVLNEIVQRLTIPDPRARYQTARGALADVRDLRARVALGDPNPELVIGTHDRRTTLAEPAFVARGAELQTLELHAREARDGRGKLVLVEADSGGGKTRLLDEFHHRQMADDVLVLRGQGYDQAALQPFQGLAGVADGLVNTAREDPVLSQRLQADLSEQREAVLAALPPLAEVLGPANTAHVPENLGEMRSISGVSSLLGSLGNASRPAVVILDDCQWADEATLKVLDFWSRDAARDRFVLVIVAFRSEDVAPDDAVRALNYSQQIVLPRFTDVDVQHLAESMTGPLPPEVLNQVIRLSEGSPFVASAMLRGLVEVGAMTISASGSWVLDRSRFSEVSASRQAADVLVRRIDLLPARSLALLIAGGVLGKTFDLTEAATLAGLEETDAIEAVDEARRRHMVWLEVDGIHCNFVHDRLRESLVARLTEPERRELHLRAARYIQEVGAERIFELAYHYDAAGEPNEALAFALQAAEVARSQHALEAAEVQYRIAQRGARDDAALQLQIADRLSDVLTLRGKYEGAEAQIRVAQQLVTDDLSLARFERKSAEVAFKRGNVVEGIQHCESALRLLGSPAPRHPVVLVAQLTRELIVQVFHTLLPRLFLARGGAATPRDLFKIRLYSDLALNYYFHKGLAPTLWAIMRNVNQAERFPPSEELARAYADHSVAMTMSGLWPRAIAYGRKSLNICREMGFLWGQGQSLNRIGMALYGASQFDDALQTSREAVRILERTGDVWEGNSIARLQVAYALWRLGDLKGASETGRELHQRALHVGDHQGAVYGLWAWSIASGGHVPHDLLQAELNRPDQGSLVRIYLLMAEGRRLLGGGRTVDAKRTLSEADALMRSARPLGGDYLVPLPLMLAAALRTEAEQLSVYAPRERLRLLKLAQSAAERGLRQSRKFKNNLPHALRETGLVAAALGDLDKAERLFTESLSVADQQGARAEQALTLLARGQVGTVAGWKDAAENLDRGHAVLSNLGAPADGTLQPPTLSLADRFDTLLEVGRRIASALSRDGILSIVQPATMELLRAERCQIVPVVDRPDGSTALGEGAEQLAEFELDLVERAVASRRPGTLDDFDMPVHDPRSSSAIAAPVLVRGKVELCIVASHTHVEGLFGAEEKRVAEFIATLTGAALENADGVREIEDLSHDVANKARDLEVKNAELSRLDRLKDEFLANTSHELRTPLNAIIGIAESLTGGAAGPVSPRQQNDLEMLIVSGRRLTNLVNDILDFSRLKEHDLKLNLEPVDIRTAIDVVIALQAPTATAKGVRLVNTLSTRLPAVKADDDRLQQILLNIIGNAVKFTDTGSITVSATVQGDQLAISVTDTGIGIESGDLERIFRSFEQAEGSSARRYSGTGLGLAITRQLVEMHGGRITVESTPGQGACFTFTLPITEEPVAERSESQLASVIPDMDLSPVTPDALIMTQRAPSTQFQILAVDDEPINLHVLGNQLALPGYDVIRETSPERALGALQDGLRPDLVLLDVMMPQMSGYELCRRIRERFSANELPVILLTAKNRIEDLVDGFSSGANDYLAKPFSREELLARIQAHLHLTRLNLASDRFVPREFLDLLGEQSLADIRLGDHVQLDMSILFSDIRSYTTISETISPRENLDFINAYLSYISPAIRAHHGIIEQYYGDGFKALFARGADNAIEAAIALRRHVLQYNVERAARGEWPIQTGVGVHTGPLLLGTIGDTSRLAVTVLSDIVNTAQRLEGLTKLYGVGVIVSDQTLRGLSDPTRFNFRYLGRIQVKGKTEPVSVYDAFDGERDEIVAVKLNTKQDFEEGLRLYHARQFAEAGQLFNRVLQRTLDDRAAQLYAQRALDNLRHGTPDDWAGVEIATEN